MGSDVAKSRLDNQLDAYFGRNGGPVLDKSGNVADPLHDPTGIFYVVMRINVLLVFFCSFYRYHDGRRPLFCCAVACKCQIALQWSSIRLI